MVPDVERELDELFGLPLEEFTRARNQLAMRLAKSGQRAQADEVKGLTKPTVPAYAVNRLARDRPREVNALLRAGDELRKAQERGLAGAGDDLRNKIQAERRAVQALTEGAREVLADEDRSTSDTTLERVAKTLHAAVADEDGRRLLEQGRMSKELEPAGFEALAGMTFRAATARKSPKRSAERGGKRVDELKRRVREARTEARRLQREAEASKSEAESAAQAAREARSKADEAKRALEKAEAELKG